MPEIELGIREQRQAELARDRIGVGAAKAIAKATYAKTLRKDD